MGAVLTSKRLSPRTRATVGFRSHLAEVETAAEAAVVATVAVEEATSTATMEVVAAWVVITK